MGLDANLNSFVWAEEKYETENGYTSIQPPADANEATFVQGLGIGLRYIGFEVERQTNPDGTTESNGSVSTLFGFIAVEYNFEKGGRQR